MNIKEVVSKSKYDALNTLYRLKREYISNFSNLSIKARYFDFLSAYHDDILKEFIEYNRTYRFFYVGELSIKVKVIAIDEKLKRITYMHEETNKNNTVSLNVALDWYLFDKWKVCHEC